MAGQSLLARYARRWAIAVTFHDTKHLLGVGQARHRVRHAVQRTVRLGS